MQPPSLALIMVRAANPEATVAFYRAIGCEFVEEKHGNGPVHHACEMGATVFEIYPGETSGTANPKDASAATLGCTVAQLDATLARLSAAGAEVRTPPKMTRWGLQATVADPDGRAVVLSESRRI